MLFRSDIRVDGILPLNLRGVGVLSRQSRLKASLKLVPEPVRPDARRLWLQWKDDSRNLSGGAVAVQLLDYWR